MTLKMTTAQFVETSVTVTNSSFQNYTHPDDHATRTTDTPGFKPFTMTRIYTNTEFKQYYFYYKYLDVSEGMSSLSDDKQKQINDQL